MNLTYQQRVTDWLVDCFGQEMASDASERLHRFVEEALELAQAGGCTRLEAEKILDYVFSRPSGSVAGEVGGVMVTLAGVCASSGIDLRQAAEEELARNRLRMPEIRAKRARKPVNSPLPQ